MRDHMYESYGDPAQHGFTGDARDDLDLGDYGPPPRWRQRDPYARIGFQGLLPEAGPHAGRGPAGWKRPDARILEDVCQRLTDDAHLDARGITVRVEDGVVWLEGDVPDRASRWRADEAAAEVAGVHDVHNRLHPRDRGLMRS